MSRRDSHCRALPRLLLGLLLAFCCQACVGQKLEPESRAAGRQRGISNTKTQKPEGMAISLRELTADLDSADAYTLYGATRVYGFVATSDAAGEDVVLIAGKERGRWRLRLDDFAVAWRNVTRNTARPACTILPKPEVLKDLSSVMARLHGGSTRQSEVKELCSRMAVLAKRPQTVHVYGVDQGSHFANAMVTADYHMKSVSNGSASMEDVESLCDILAREAKASLGAQGAGTLCLKVFSRFWFNPGEMLFTQNGRTVLLTECEVVLLPEDQAITATGNLAGLQKSSPSCKEFAEQFTKAYKKVAKQAPVYRELENLYRWIAIVDLMTNKKTTGLNLREVLRGFMEKVKVEPFDFHGSLPGKYNMKEIEGTVMTPQGPRYYKGRIPTFGGVSIAIRVTLDNLQRDPRGAWRNLKTLVLTARPASNTTHWQFAMPAELANL